MLTWQLVLSAELPNGQPRRAVAEIGSALLHALQKAALLGCIGPAPEAGMRCSTDIPISWTRLSLSKRCLLSLLSCCEVSVRTGH